MKDQTKKVASLKHKEQVEKSRNARLMEEARKREDNMSENSQQVKVRHVCGSLGLYERCIRTKFTFAGTDSLVWCLTNQSLTSLYSCSEGLSASEVRAHRGAGGGPERECSDHCGARDGTGSGGGCQVTPRETGI